MSTEQVEAEFEGWIPDPGYSRTRDTKIFKLTKLYQLNKAFIAEIVEEKGSQYQDIMHKLNVMERKFHALCREIFNIEITVHSYAENQNGNEEND